MRKIGSETARECPSEYAFRYVGGAWKILIVSRLVRNKTHRHAELKQMLRGITSKMLTQQLRELEHDGLVERTLYAEVPPPVEYRLTPLGETLLSVLQAMYAWGAKTREAVSRAMPETNPRAGAAKSPRLRTASPSPAADCY